MGLDSVELLLHAEEEFDIRIPDEIAEQIRTVRQFHKSVLQISKEQNNSVLNSEETMEKLVEIVAEQLGVKREDVTPDARFIEDLSMDAGVCPRLGI